MIPRYQTQVMSMIFSDANKFRTWFLTELAYFESYIAHNGGDNALIARVRGRAEGIDWESFATRVAMYEKDTKHDVIAFLQVLEEDFGKDAQFFHFGLTSSDIVDTSFAIILGTACDEIVKKISMLIDVLWRKALCGQGVLCLGRTHGQAAEPTTFGLKLLSHLVEFLRARRRLKIAQEEIKVGKFSGAVGNYSHTDPRVEEEALIKLDLLPETVATQIVARDRHASLFTSLATLAGSVERLALEIRLLMHGQVQEVFEPFYDKQKGSSAMPHKKNPILSENLSGLMRLIRGYSLSAMENQALWHERDISHSSVERVIAPDAFNVMDFALTRLFEIISALQIDEKRMGINLSPYTDILSSQAIMLALIKKGMTRQQAYELVQRAAHRDPSKSFVENLCDLGIHDVLSDRELEDLMATDNKVRSEDLIFERVQRLIFSGSSS